MSQFASKMQVQFKKTSSDMFTFTVRFLTGAVLGLTFALVVQEIMGKHEGENMLSFLFMVVVILSAFLRISRKWSLPSVLIFDLICVLVGMLLRLYIVVAPGA